MRDVSRRMSPCLSENHESLIALQKRDQPQPQPLDAAGQSVDLSDVEAVLLSSPLIEAGVILVWPSPSAVPRRVAYVVPSAPLRQAHGLSHLPAQLKQHLDAYVPADSQPDAYVPITRLPLTSTGDVDTEVLAHLPVIDDEVIPRLEQALQAIPDIQHAVVVEREWRPNRPPLHLSDLLPSWHRANRQPRGTSGTASVDQAERMASGHIAAPGEASRRAISFGGPLPEAVDRPMTLAACLERAATHSPDYGVVYIKSDETDQFQSYPALLDAAQRIVAGLRRQGLRPGDKIIFQLEHNWDYIPAFWGCALGGFIPVPMSIPLTYDASNSAVNRLQHAWEMLDRPVILSCSERLSALCAHAPDFQVVAIETLREHAPDPDWHDSQPDDIALLLLTSGSTGQPKAVVQHHRSLLDRSAGAAHMNRFTRRDISLNWMPLDHVGGVVMFHLRDVFAACQQIHAPTHMVLSHPLKWLDWIERYRATATWAPNFGFGLVNDQAEAIQNGGWDLSSMRFVLNGGEAIVAKTAWQFLQLLAPHGLVADAMYPAWGMSETCSGVTYHHPFSLSTTTDDDTFVSVGQPIPGVSIRIAETGGRVIEEGAIGHVHIQGTAVTSGYFQAPESNREAFTDDGWFDTGDLGFLRDGALTITGRAKDVIIINGINYYSHEVEAVADTVDGVEVSYTAACAVRDIGSDTDQLAIFFSPQISYQDRLHEVLSDIQRQVVQRVGLSPAYLIPVEKADIPKTSIGKIQRTELRQRFEAGAFNDALKRVDVLSANANTLPDWFYRKAWRPRNIRSSEQTRGWTGACRAVLVCLDQAGLGAGLCTAFEQANLRCIRLEIGDHFSRLGMDHYAINPKMPAHYQRLFREMMAEEVWIDRIVYLWAYGQSAAPSMDLDALKAAQHTGIYSLLFLTQAMTQVQQDGQHARLYAITSNVHAVTNVEDIAFEKSTMVGLLKTIPLELPWLSCHHIDLEVDQAAHNTALILEELCLTRGATEVAYRDRQRFIASLVRVEMALDRHPECALQLSGIYLLTGGLGGVGAHLAHELIKTYGIRLIVVGRTVLPPRATWEAHLGTDTALAKRIEHYLKIEAAGGSFVYEAIDVCDHDGLQRVIAAAESRWGGALAGVMHLAGEGHLESHWQTMDAHHVATEHVETFEMMFRPKVYGTWTLYQLLKNRPQAIFISFSSVNSLFGGATFSAYSAANSFLDCYSVYQRRQFQSYCFNWTMWDDVGMSRGNPSYAREASATMGYRIVSIAQGLNAFCAGLYRNEPQLIVGLDGDHPRLQDDVADERAYQTQSLYGYVTGRDGVLSPELLVGTWRDIEVCDALGAPIDYHLVPLPQMPLTALGEIDRQALIALGTSSDRVTMDRVAPQTGLEKTIAVIWSELLQLESVGIHDNFFELGGHSILLVQAHSQLQQELHRDLTIVDLFRYPTVHALAGYLGQTDIEQPDYEDVRRRAEQQRAALDRRRRIGQHRKPT